MTTLGVCASSIADVSLASVFNDNMVLQRGMPAPVWGKAGPGETVTVSFAGQSKTVKASPDGRWLVKLDPLEASATPRTLTVSDKIALKNVLVGEVWLCSGQSNMEWPLSKVTDAGKELADAVCPRLRLLKTPRTPADAPLAGLHRRAHWEESSPASAANFSAVAYFFGRELVAKLDVPVGLIDASWGGTSAQSWMDTASLAAFPECALALAQAKERAAKARAGQPPGLNPLPGEQLHGAADNAGFRHAWAKLDAPVGDWGSMELPGTWQKRGHDFSGVFWFRKDVELPATWANRPLELGVGAVDKEDVTYFNGAAVGATTYADSPMSYCTPRHYNVPAGLARAGRNVVAVRARSDFFDGGMAGPAAAMALRCPSLPDSPAIPLDGAWRHAVESNYGLCRPELPAALFNGMISPLIPFAFRGALWYQGENNMNESALYRRLLPALIKGWRSQWGQGDFPFHVVQLANWQTAAEFQANSNIALLREAQTAALELPNTAMAVALDLGSTVKPDCHFPNKRPLGERLAAAALAKDYGMKDIPCQGPTFKAAKFADGRAVVSFDNPSGGLVATGGGPLRGFVLAGADGVFHSAQARVDGETVVLESKDVPAPVAVRYAWADNPLCNLHNSAGFPAAPFRNDAQSLK